MERWLELFSDLLARVDALECKLAKVVETLKDKSPLQKLCEGLMKNIDNASRSLLDLLVSQIASVKAQVEDLHLNIPRAEAYHLTRLKMKKLTWITHSLR